MAEPKEEYLPEGLEVEVVSTRKDKNCTGTLTWVGVHGVFIAFDGGKRRYYPWPQIAYIEWDIDR